jgi:hypothetical protein
MKCPSSGMKVLPAVKDAYCLIVSFTRVGNPAQIALETLTVAQLVKKFPTIYCTRRFITVLTRARQ